MSSREVWVGRLGSWVGTKRVWVDPEAPVRESESRAVVTLVAQGNYLELRYTWSEGGKPQDGMLVVRLGEPQEAAIDAAWVDSWHQGREIMVCRGQAQEGGVLSVEGHYAAPPDPDWGWRIVLRPTAAGAWELLMYNISPQGQEDLGVQASFARDE